MRTQQIERPKKVFFAFTMDCEAIASESCLGQGTVSWEMSEKAILGMADVLRTKNVTRAGAFYPTPLTAERQKDVFLALKAEGFDIGCQFHCDTFRKGRYEKYLGEYGHDEQQEILTLAKEDWEDALGLPMKTFRCGFCSASDHTFPILNDLGVRQSSSSMPERHIPKIAARWAGAFPYAHHANPSSRLLPGDLEIFEVPVTTHPYRWADKAHTVAHDLRPDRGLDMDIYRDMIDARMEHMLRSDPPIKTIVAITHNTIDYLDTENPKRKIMEFEIDYVRQAVEAAGNEFVPVSLEDIHREADELGSF